MQCQPDRFYQRGKLLITSSGRILCWSLDVHQSRRGLDAATIDYAINHRLTIYQVMNLCEINFTYDDTFHHVFCPCRSCRSYNCGLDLAFHHYQHHIHTRHSFLRSYDSSHYFAALRAYLSTSSQDYWLPTQQRSGSGGGLDHSIRILGEARNLGYDPEVPLLSLENLSSLMSQILKTLSELGPGRNQLWLSSKESEYSELRRSSVRFDLSDVPNADQRDASPNKKYSLQQDFQNYEPVNKESGAVDSLSLKWIPLAPNEEIVSSYGILPKFSFWEYLLMIWTMGFYYCVCGGRSKMRRHLAYILTTQRIIEVYLQVSHSVIHNLVHLHLDKLDDLTCPVNYLNHCFTVLPLIL
jgi:hypothetical protein